MAMRLLQHTPHYYASADAEYAILLLIAASRHAAIDAYAPRWLPLRAILDERYFDTARY